MTERLPKLQTPAEGQPSSVATPAMPALAQQPSNSAQIATVGTAVIAPVGTSVVAQPLPAHFFQQLFQAQHAYVFHSLRRLGVAERDLEDLTHDVFMVVHRKLGEYDPARPIKPWLLGIAARVASDYRKLARHRDQVLAAPEVADARPSADVQMQANDAQALVIAALAAVDDSRRALLVMVDIDDMAVTDAAEVMSIPLNTAYSRLRLARKEFSAAVLRLRAKRGEP
jgi:RNA polymerase sigma-70 factor (ECF subfamily)